MGTTVSIWGVRGALPAADRQYMEYGGNTSCVSLNCGGGVLCFDAGSGLLGLMDRVKETDRLDILISHVHMDHILGLYGLIGCKAAEIHIYGEARRGVSFLGQLEAVTGRPYWPVGLKDMEGRVTVHEISPGDRLTLPREGGEILVSTLRGNHPDGSVLYRAEAGGRSVAYTLDCEMGGRMADALADWGHSTWEEGLAVGRAAGAKRILMTHYSRDYTDEFLRGQERLAQKECGACAFAREGMVIAL